MRRLRTIMLRWRRRLGLAPPLAQRGYMICAAPRSGSNYLCQLLGSSRMLGRPKEYFNVGSRRRNNDPHYPTDPRAQFEIIRSAGATPNGIYAVKLLSTQLKSFKGKADPFRDLPNLALVRLERRDLLGQAISLVRARQTGQFVAMQQPKNAPTYDAMRIRQALCALQEQRLTWDRIMNRLGVQPLILEYESIAENPQSAVDQVASLMGLMSPVPIKPEAISYTVQRDAINHEWRHRFLEEIGEEFRDLLDEATPPLRRDSASVS